MPTQYEGLRVRINGTRSPAVQPSNELDKIANTSCSIFDNIEGPGGKNSFHLLVDCGDGVFESLMKGFAQQRISGNAVPDAVLITHGHKDHVSDLPTLLSEVEKKSQQPDFKIYCTRDCLDEIMKTLPSVSDKSLTFSAVTPGNHFEVGPFLVEPILAEHGNARGAVVYIVKGRGKKIVLGWDFESIPGVDQGPFWNPDLLVLGTETYNDHRFSTGMISVSEAYNVVRRWNAKDCYILHYSGQQDTEDAKNQWFRGPTRPLSQEELQRMIDEHLRATGDSGRFSVKVAHEGMIWTPQTAADIDEDSGDKAITTGDRIEIEGLEKYMLTIEKKEGGNKLIVTVEDSINRLSSEFSDAHVSRKNDEINLEAKPLKSFMMKGPELRMSLFSRGDDSLVTVYIAKGKKVIFSDEIRLTSNALKKLSRYITENFVDSS